MSVQNTLPTLRLSLHPSAADDGGRDSP